MADPHAPVRLLVARHGDATYSTPRGVMSLDGGSLTPTGRDQVVTMARSLVGQAVTHVYASTLSRAQESAGIVARELGVATSVIGGVQEYEVGDLVGARYDDPRARAVFTAWMDGDLAAGFPGGETGAHIVERFRIAVEEVAERHPGESVVVISHGGVMSLAIPRLSRNVRDDLARRQYLPNATPADVRVDDEGMWVESWPGTEDKHAV